MNEKRQSLEALQRGGASCARTEGNSSGGRPATSLRSAGYHDGAAAGGRGTFGHEGASRPLGEATAGPDAGAPVPTAVTTGKTRDDMKMK